MYSNAPTNAQLRPSAKGIYYRYLEYLLTSEITRNDLSSDLLRGCLTHDFQVKPEVKSRIRVTLFGNLGIQFQLAVLSSCMPYLLFFNVRCSVKNM